MEYATPSDKRSGVSPVERSLGRAKIIELASGGHDRRYCSATWPQRRRLCVEQLNDQPLSVCEEVLELLRKYV